jgi:hypothetical protein
MTEQRLALRTYSRWGWKSAYTPGWSAKLWIPPCHTQRRERLNEQRECARAPMVDIPECAKFTLLKFTWSPPIVGTSLRVERDTYTSWIWDGRRRSWEGISWTKVESHLKLDRNDGHVVPSVSGRNRDGQVGLGPLGNRLKYGKSARSYTQMAEAGTSQLKPPSSGDQGPGSCNPAGRPGGSLIWILERAGFSPQSFLHN